MLSLGARLSQAVELSKGYQSRHFDVGKEANRKQQSYLKLSINCVEHSPLEGGSVALHIGRRERVARLD